MNGPLNLSIFIYIINISDCFILFMYKNVLIYELSLLSNHGQQGHKAGLCLPSPPISIKRFSLNIVTEASHLYTTQFSRVKTCARQVLIQSTSPTHFPSFEFGEPDQSSTRSAENYDCWPIQKLSVCKLIIAFQ